MASLTTLAAGALGVCVAAGLASLAPRPRWWGQACAILALAMPPFVTTNCWFDLLGSSGLLRPWLRLDLFSLGGAVWLLTLQSWPVTTLAVMASWQRLEPEQLEVEPALRGWVAWRWLLWPMSRQAASLAALLTFVLALSNFAIPVLLQVPVLPEQMWISFSTNLQTAQAFQLAWPLILPPLLLLLGLGCAREMFWPGLDRGFPAPLFRRRLGSGGFRFCAVVTSASSFLSVGVPLLQLTASARTWIELLPAFAAGTTALANSVFYAASAATLVVVAGLLGAREKPLRIDAAGLQDPVQGPQGGQDQGMAQAISSRAGSLARAFQSIVFGRGLSWLLWLPFLVPGVFVGILLIWTLNRPGVDWIYRSPAVVLLGLGIRYLAPGWFGARIAWHSVDPHLLDAARLDRVRGWALFRHVLWPQMSAPLASAWYIVFLLCLWDVETLVLILPPGGETLASRLFNLLHYGHNGQVNALCVWLLAVALLPFVIWRMGGARGRWRAGSIPPDSGTDLNRMGSVFGGLGATLALAGVSTGLVGCSPSSGGRSAPVKSRLFTEVRVFGTRGAGAGEFNKPRSVAVDAQDRFYVADMTGRIQKFSPDGQWLLAWQMPVTELGKPKGMCRDNLGRIVVVEPHYQRINHFSPDGKLVAQWGGHLTNGGPFALPRAVAVNSRDEVIVSDYTLAERVRVFAPEGRKRLVEFGRFGSGPGEFNRPEGVAVDAAGRIYVADSCNHRIQVFAPDGKFLRAYGKPGTGRGELSYPYDICVDREGRQYVCEFGNSRIQIFDAEDRFIEMLGGAGAAPGKLANPWGLALDSSGNLYVADSQNHRVQKFIAAGRPPKGKSG